MIVSERLKIRMVGKEDFPSLHELKNDPDVIRGEGHFFSFPLAKLERIYSTYFDSTSSRKALVIESKESGKLIGEVSLDIDWVHRFAEIGITIGKQFWGKGFATEALIAVKNHSFKQIGLNRLQAAILATNTGSRKAFEKAGFREEGVFRKARIHAGNFVDLICVAVLADN